MRRKIFHVSRSIISFRGLEEESTARRYRSQEEAELDEEVRFLDELQDIPHQRRSKLIRIREQIRQGTYLTDDKLKKAMERLLTTLDQGHGGFPG